MKFLIVKVNFVFHSTCLILQQLSFALLVENPMGAELAANDRLLVQRVVLSALATNVVHLGSVEFLTLQVLL